MDKLEISSESSADEVIEWARYNYYENSERCRKLLTAIESEDSSILANKFNILGILDMYDSEYYTCITNLTEALNIAKRNEDNELLAKIYLNLCSVHERLENYPEAIRYARKVFSTGQSKRYGSTFNNLARIHFMQGNIELAQNHLEESINAYNQHNDPGVFHGYFLRSEILKDNKEYEKALESYKFILEFLKTTNLGSFTAATLNEVGHTYLMLGKPKEGIPYIEKGIAAAIEYNMSRDSSLGHLRLAECYTALKDYENADLHLEVFLTDENEKKGTGMYYRLANEIRIKNYKESKDERLSSAYEHYIDYLTNFEIDNTRKVHQKYLKSRDSEIKEIRDKADAINIQNEELRYISKLLAHDLKTPVRTIGSFNTLLGNTNSNLYNEESKEYSDFISLGAKEIYKKLDITERYLNLRIDKKGKDISLAELIKEVHSNFYKNSIDLKIKGELTLDSGDELNLKEAFHILFTNYIAADSILPIVLRMNCNKEMKQLRISDDRGISIVEESWKRNIFNSQSDELSEGLSFFTKIIQLHQGKISINENEKFLEINF